MKTKTNTSPRLYNMVLMGMMAAVLCVVAPWSIPIGDVPITLTLLAVYLTIYVLGWKRGTVSCLVFLLLGAFGLPVFSGFSGGLGKLFGPTGGYLVSYIPLCIISGFCIDHTKNPILQGLALVLGTAICYTIGTAWYCMQGSHPLVYALSVCVIPFIPFDLAKIVLGVLLGNLLRNRLHAAGLA